MPIPGGPTIPNIPPRAFTGLFDAVGFRALQGLTVGSTGPLGPCRSVRVGGVIERVAVGIGGPLEPVPIGPIEPVELVMAIGSGDSGVEARARACAACITCAGARAACDASADALFPCMLPIFKARLRYSACLYGAEI